MVVRASLLSPRSWCGHVLRSPAVFNRSQHVKGPRTQRPFSPFYYFCHDRRHVTERPSRVAPYGLGVVRVYGFRCHPAYTDTFPRPRKRRCFYKSHVLSFHSISISGMTTQAAMRNDNVNEIHKQKCEIPPAGRLARPWTRRGKYFNRAIAARVYDPLRKQNLKIVCVKN